jgi:hypothetical protein
MVHSLDRHIPSLEWAMNLTSSIVRYKWYD